MKLIILAIIVSFTSCEKDDVKPEIESPLLKQENIFKTISFKELSNNKNILKEINAFKNNRLSSEFLGRTINDSITGLEIDTDFVSYLESVDGQYHSYTFNVTNTPKGVGLENVFFSLQSDGSYKKFIAYYDLTEIEINDLQKGKFVDIENKLQIFELPEHSFSNLELRLFYDDSSNCWMNTRWISGDNCNEQGNHSYEDVSEGLVICTADIGPTQGYSESYVVTCNQTGSGFNDGITTNSPDGTQQTGAGGVVTTNNDTTVATSSQSWEDVEDCLQFRTDFTPEMLTYLQTYRDIAAQMDAYIEQDGCVQNVQQFGINALNALMTGGEVDFDENIIYSVDGECHKSILKKLVEVYSPFTAMIKNVFGESETINVKFWNGDNNGNPASTNPIYSGNTNDYTINIKFDTDYLNTATDLSVVAVTLHELSHAYFISQYLEGNLNSSSSNYVDLNNAFIAFYENSTQDTFDTFDNEIHNAMNDFIQKMANAIYNYAQSNDIPNVTQDYCISLAWGTMHSTTLFSEMLTTEEQMNAQNIVITEQNNNEYDPSYPIKGTPCD